MNASSKTSSSQSKSCQSACCVVLALVLCGSIDAPLLAGTVHLLPDGAAEPVAFEVPAGLEDVRAQKLGNAILVVGVDAASERIELTVFGPDKSLVRLPSPNSSAHPQRPLAIVDDVGVTAVAWLAGEATQVSVEAAVWGGESWLPTTVISKAGPGSQLALRGALAADGRAVLAWSRFDGTDDEIVWSRQEASGWSAPRRVGADDEVPDITPALGQIEGVLHLAWSEWDGDAYRLRLARFDGDDWIVVKTLPERGAFAPQFEAESVLTYRDGESRQWVARRLAADAATIERSALAIDPTSSQARPELLLGTDSQSFWVLDGASSSAQWTDHE